jgi:hypothetical protein
MDFVQFMDYNHQQVSRMLANNLDIDFPSIIMLNDLCRGLFPFYYNSPPPDQDLVHYPAVHLHDKPAEDTFWHEVVSVPQQ